MTGGGVILVVTDILMSRRPISTALPKKAPISIASPWPAEFVPRVRTAVMTGHFPARYAIDGHFAWVPSNAKRGMPDWLDTKAPSLSEDTSKGGLRHCALWEVAPR